MRKFSRQEQDFIKKLIENSKDLMSNFPINILDNYFNENQFEIDFSKSILIFWRQCERVENDEINIVLEKLFKIECLVQFLKENGLVYEIKLDINKLNRFGYNGSQNNLKEISYTLLNGNFVNLKSCLNNPFFVTEELKDLANYNFKSIEEQILKEANKQSRMSGISAFLAFLTFLASILVPVLIATCKGKL